MLSSTVFGFLYIVKPHLIVAFSDWAYSVMRGKDGRNASLRPLCAIMMLPVSPVRWWDRSGRTLDSWVSLRLQQAKKGLAALGVPESGSRYDVFPGDSCKAIPANYLDGKIAEAFPDGKSGLLILGEHDSSRRWLLHRVVHWAIDEKPDEDRTGGGPDGSSIAVLPEARIGRPMLPVIVDEDELLGEESQKLDEEQIRAIVCRKLSRLIGTRRTISQELHDTLVEVRLLMVICHLPSLNNTRLIAMIQRLYSDWVISTKEVAGHEGSLFAEKITILRVEPQTA
jgi:hypothetical protein